MLDLLQDIRVLDLTRRLPGPYATLLLADLGAEVIKIEEPGRGDPLRSVPPFVSGRSTRFLALNRNKKSLTLNLKASRGRKILLQLTQRANVLVEDFRPGAAQRLGIDYEHVRQGHPEIIYCSLTGYGQQGPYRDHVGHDLNYIARAGLLNLTGTGERPIIPGVPVADLAGAMFAAFSILAALRAQDQGRGGTFLDISLTDAVISWMTIHFAEYFSARKSPRVQDLVLAGAFPCYHVYETGDRKYIAIGALEEKFWAKLCKALGVPEFIPHQFSEEKREELFHALREIFQSKPREQWLKELNPKEVPIAPVLDLAEVAQGPQVRARGLVWEEEFGIAFPVRVSNAGGQSDRRAPELGEHTHEVLSQLGYSPTDIDRLTQQRII